MQSIRVDVVVAGAGPAGRWLGAQLARRGIRVALIDANQNREWPNTYGVWLDEVDEMLPRESFRQVWPSVVVVANRRHVVDRRYGLIDNETLRRQFDGVIDEGGAVRIRSAVGSLQAEENRVVAHCTEGESVEATLVVDATGARGGLTDTTVDHDGPCQRAYGMVATMRGDPLCGDEMVLMDFRPPTPDSVDDNGPPTFLYGMRLGRDRYFVEETVLVGSASASFSMLRRRLMQRLRRRGVAVCGEPSQVERCHIPMGTPLGSIEGPVLPFGALAGLVHPATGYQMGRMLRAGPAVADVIARGLEQGRGGRAIARRGWSALWPDELRNARRLLVFGRDVLRPLDAEGLRRFFEVFFELPPTDWRDYLLGDVGARRLAAIMWQLFGRADHRLRWALIRRAVADGRLLVEGLSPVAAGHAVCSTLWTSG